MGRRNTKLEACLQESKKVKSFASVESNETLPWLGSDDNTSPREPTCRGALNQLIGWCSDDLLSAHGLPYIAGRQLARHR